MKNYFFIFLTVLITLTAGLGCNKVTKLKLDGVVEKIVWKKEEWKVVVRDVRVFSFDENNKLLKTREMKGEVLIVRKPSVAVELQLLHLNEGDQVQIIQDKKNNILTFDKI